MTPPRDMQKWADFMRAFTLHVRERYGHDEVKTWYFEVWNEPNLDGFWAGTQQQYFDLYAASARAIKSVSPEYKVGGPGTAGCGWIKEFREILRDQPVASGLRLHAHLRRRERLSG